MEVESTIFAIISKESFLFTIISNSEFFLFKSRQYPKEFKYYYQTYSRITIIGVKIADLKNSRCNPLGKANDAKIVVITMKFFDVLLLGGNFLSFFTERFVSYFRNLSLVVLNAGDKPLYFHPAMRYFLLLLLL